MGQWTLQKNKREVVQFLLYLRFPWLSDNQEEISVKGVVESWKSQSQDLELEN